MKVATSSGAQELRRLMRAASATSAAEQLAIGAQELVGFQKEMDGLFESLVDCLGSASGRISALLEAIEDVRTAQRTAFVQVAVEATQEMAAAFRSETRAVAEQNTRLGTAIEGVRRAEEDTAGALARMVVLSRWLRMAGLNCSTLATRSGSDEAVFATLSRELSHRAHSIIEIGSRVEATSSRIHYATTAIGGLSGVLGSASREEVSLASPIADLFAVLETIFGSLGDVVDRVRRVQDAIAHIMLAAQKQDILRQELEHIALALRELDADAARLAGIEGEPAEQTGLEVSHHLVFQERIGSLSASLLESCGRSLGDLMRDTAAALQDLGAATAILGETKERFSEAVERRLGSPIRALEAIYRGLMEHLQGCAGYAELARELPKLTEALRKDLGSIEDAARATRVVNTMMRMEIARSTRLDGARSLLDELGGKVCELERLLQGSGTGLARLDGRVGDASRLLDDVDVSRQRFVKIGEMLREHPRRVMEAAQTLGSALNEIAQVSEQNRSALDDVEREFAAFRRSTPILERLAALTGASAAGARALIGEAQALGCFTDPGDLLRDRLKTVIDRFTVFSQKSAGSAMTSIDVAAGDAGGTLTLF